MPILELDVLKPLDPSISNSDDYEIFTLSNAQVSYAKNGKQANLLVAYADTPLKVEGRLETPHRSQLKYVIKKPFKPIDIELRNVTRFSYGQTEDGETVIWALGGAGWFELRPAKNYESTFRDMVEAVEILYFVTDIYNEPRKRGGGPNAQLIFQEYAEDERFACDDTTQASRIFHKHRAFLIMSFLNRAQDIAWSNTPLYQHLKKQFPKNWDDAKARIEGKSLDKNKQEKLSKSESATKGSKGKRQAKVTEKVPQAPKKDDNWWESAAIFEFMQKAVNQGAMRIGHITLDRLAKLLVKRYEIDEIETARNAIMIHAANLCYMMDRPRKRTQYFAHEPIYEELSSGHNVSAAEVKRAESVGLKPRKDHSSLKDDISSDSDSNSSLETPQRRPPHQKKGLLSVLRPTSGKFSGKGKGVRGKGKGKKPILDEDGSSGLEAETISSASDIEIDTPTQKFSPGKRKFVSGASDAVPRKRAASGSLDLESPLESSDEAEETGKPLPLRWRNGNVPAKSSSPALLPPVVSSPLPDYTANAPGDSWICTFDGCSQKVFGASTDVGRTLIKEHLDDHAKGRQKEVGLILSEESKLRLPVNNLLKRIREMAEAQQSLFPSLGPESPATPMPIQRRV